MEEVQHNCIIKIVLVSEFLINRVEVTFCIFVVSDVKFNMFGIVQKNKKKRKRCDSHTASIFRFLTFSEGINDKMYLLTVTI